jgi:HTH-type transcriptional regulator / antitoxin HigA
MTRIRSDAISAVSDDSSQKAALAEIDRRWGTPADTPDGDYLDALMTFVDAYERHRWPDETSEQGNDDVGKVP